jgi:hypothetical protein
LPDAFGNVTVEGEFEPGLDMRKRVRRTEMPIEHDRPQEDVENLAGDAPPPRPIWKAPHESDRFSVELLGEGPMGTDAEPSEPRRFQRTA